MGPVLIIGGGVGGLGAALALTAAGYDAAGAELGLAPLSGHEHPLTRYRCLRRADLCAVLHAEAVRRGVPIRHGARLTGIEEDADGVTATFADGSTARGALLVAADGLHSVTRTLLDPGTAAPRYTGQRVY